MLLVVPKKRNILLQGLRRVAQKYCHLLVFWPFDGGCLSDSRAVALYTFCCISGSDGDGKKEKGRLLHIFLLKAQPTWQHNAGSTELS